MAAMKSGEYIELADLRYQATDYKYFDQLAIDLKLGHEEMSEGHE